MKMLPKCIMLNKIPSYAKCLETDNAAESKETHVKLEKHMCRGLTRHSFTQDASTRDQ
jgi:hypothetical protein